jgi:PleD family two-component response regulator
VSVGVAVAERTGEDLGALIKRADAALFRAKAAGRDRIALS